MCVRCLGCLSLACSARSATAFTAIDRAAAFDQQLMTLSEIASRRAGLFRAEQMFGQSDPAVLISH